MQRTPRPVPVVLAALAVLGVAGCQRSAAPPAAAPAPAGALRVLDAGSLIAGQPVLPPRAGWC